MTTNLVGVPPDLRCTGRVRHDDRSEGQATLVILGALAVVVAVLLGLARIAAELIGQAHADAAADAAALAAVLDGARAASMVAEANGAEVLSIELEPGWANLTVLWAGHRATSTAALVQGRPPPGQ